MTATAQASPWDALLRPHRPIRRPDPIAETATEARPGTKLSRLLEALASSGGLSTQALAFACDLTDRQVWGLLKAPRAAGQVVFERGRWSLAASFPGRDVQRAVDLLRSKGWRVEPPLEERP